MDPIDLGYKRLAAAIIQQACEDYYDALMKLKEKPGDLTAAKTIEDAENFFYSDWFEVLGDLDPDQIIRLLKQKAQHDS